MWPLIGGERGLGAPASEAGAAKSSKEQQTAAGAQCSVCVCVSMFSAECVSVLLLCVCAAATATINNSTPHLRTFVLFPSSVTDEPLNLDLLDLYDRTNESSRFRVNVTHHVHPQFSEEALLFLSGPVSTIFIPCFYTLVCVVSIPINVCAVLAFARGIRPKKPAAIYMLNLAMADLLFAMLLPFKIFYHFNGNNWRLGSVLCRVVTAAFYWNMYCSVLLIACISVDRLLAVVYPIDSLTWRRPKHAVTACALMWTVSLAGSVPLVSSEQTTFLQQLNIITCHDVQHVENVAWLKVYFLFLCSALFFLPLLVTLTSYARVLWSLCRIPKGVAGSSRRRRRAVVMALTVLLIFLVCFMPTNVLLFVHYLLFSTSVETSRETPDGSYAAYLVFLCVGSLNCILDPLVYYFGSSQCQKQLSSLLTCQKISDRNKISHSSSDSCSRSSSRTFLKSSRTESSRTNGSDANADANAVRENLHSQYRKLLV